MIPWGPKKIDTFGWDVETPLLWLKAVAEIGGAAPVMARWDAIRFGIPERMQSVAKRLQVL